MVLPQVQLHHPQVPSEVSSRTAARWIHKLGFEPSSTKKGVYIYLRKLEALESTHAPRPPTYDEPDPEPSDRRKLVLIFIMRAEKGKQPIKPKSQGRGTMVSNFTDKHCGYLCLSDEEYER